MKTKFILFAATILTLTFSANAQTEKARVLAKSKQVITALKNKNVKTLATYVHPTKGVRFSMTTYVYTDKDLTLWQKEVRKIYSLPAAVWGQNDASGDDIKLNFADYYKRYVYDKDFARAPKIIYNKFMNRYRGAAGVNLSEVYPNGKFVEYHFPGTKKNDGMDWRSLHLVFEKSGKTWYLVGIAHDEWGI